MTSLRDPRHSVLLHTTICADGVAPAEGRVRNISRGGMMAECAFGGREGDRVEISLRGVGDCAGRVAWACKDRIGVMFDEPIDPGKVLRRPARGVPVSYTPRPAPRGWRPALHGS